MAKQKLCVGRSTSRTPVKHFLLDSALGKVAGVLGVDSPHVPCRASKFNPLVCVDLCGGDGLVTHDHDASPRIMYQHCQHLRQRCGKPADLSIIEKQDNTFEQLRINCADMEQAGFVRLIHGDSRNYRLPPLGDSQAAFVHCDPNSVDQTPLTEEFVKGFNRYTTYLVTLGCNVSGLKAWTGQERREGWFEYVKLLSRAMPGHHDALLFWLNRDSAQWAYLLSFPVKWSPDFMADSIRKTGKIWEKGVSGLSYGNDRLKFDDQIKRLFLTGDEYARQ
jgi:hypothetical protein